jgi:dual specificity phosphatase 12
MDCHRLDADAALAAVRAAHPCAAPNDGFLEQLRLFGSMHCTLDESCAAFRRFRLASLAAAGCAPGATPLVADPGGEDGGGGSVRCRKCRRLLATAEHTISHPRGAGARAFGQHKQHKGAAVAGTEAPCSSVFVEPMGWMAEELRDGAQSGKLACPKCSGRLGGFCWAGEQCSCGAWVTPAFQLHSARVDVTR